MSKTVTDWINDKCFIVDDLINQLANNKKKPDFMYPTLCQYLATGNSYEDIHTRLFENPEEVMVCLERYQEVISKINLITVFIPSIENFCMFMGWTAQVYKQMLNDSPEDIKAVMQMVDDFIIESQMAAGQLGYSKASLTKFRSQIAGNHGQNFVTQKEENDNNKSAGKTKSPEELQRELENMGFKMINQK